MVYNKGRKTRVRLSKRSSIPIDALNRPISRNADTFGYNNRSEVTSANISGIPTGP